MQLTLHVHRDLVVMYRWIPKVHPDDRGGGGWGGWALDLICLLFGTRLIKTRCECVARSGVPFIHKQRRKDLRSPGDQTQMEPADE